MSRTVLCNHCKSTFIENELANKENPKICPVCSKSLLDEGEIDNKKEITWYYYGFKDQKGNKKTDSFSLEDKLIDLDEFGHIFYLIKEFQAPPRDVNGNCDAAKAKLRKYIPNAFAPAPSMPEIKCPRCGSKEIQLVPKRFSVLTGFLTNHYDRMCVFCKKKF